MAKRSFRYPPTHPTLPNVLAAWGYTDTNSPGDIAQVESDDFNLDPFQWKWNGTTWIPFIPPLPPPSDLAIALDAALSGPTPTIIQIRAVFQAWRTQVR